MARREKVASSRRRYSRPRRGRMQAFAGTAVVLLMLLGPRLGDVVNAGVTRTDGCRIYGIVDGDTVRMHCPGSGFGRTRLTGFDTPEFRAGCGRELIMAFLATQALRWELWRAGEIAVRERGQDRYGRRLAQVRVDGSALSARMIDTGLARIHLGGMERGWCA